MGQDKHQPKNKKDKFSISDDAEKTLLGIMITLIGMIGLLNRGVVGEFLTYLATYIFGAFYFFFFFFLIAFGLFLAIKKKALTFKVNLYFLGAFLLIAAMMMAASLGIDKLSIKSLFSVYNNQMSLVSSSLFKVDNFKNLGSTGGGFIGCMLVALLNSAITVTGTRIVTIFLLVAGAALLLKVPLARFFRYIKKISGEAKAKKLAKRQTSDAVGDSKEAPAALPAVELAAAPSKSELADDSDFAAFQPSPFRSTAPLPDPSAKKSDLPPLVNESEIASDLPQLNELGAAPTDKSKANPFLALFRKKERDDEEDGDFALPPEQLATAPSLLKSRAEAPSEPSVQFCSNETVIDDTPRVRSVPSTARRYILPSVSMLSDHRDNSKDEINQRASQERAELINGVFNDFKIRASVISYTIGPSVTRFNVRTDPGVRVNSIANLVDEIQVALSGDKSVRIETVVQGKDTSGIEVGNTAPTPVSFKDCFGSLLSNTGDKLLVPIGQDINREVITVSLDDLPHLLVAGTTGSGKSVFIHSIIMTLIMRNYPEELRLIMIDPKKVEFAKYNNIPHLYCPIITDPVQATAALFKLVNEMERRFTIMAREEVVNIKEYREKQKQDPSKENIPNIVVIVDEFADLISNNAKEVEPLIQRLAQKARAAGIYLIVATQRPSVNVITGDIKANIPARVALSVSSTFDSKTILDEFGAETLIGKGDLLARIPSRKALIRVQSAYVDNDEISRVTSYLKEQEKPQFNQEFLNLRLDEEGESDNLAGGRPSKAGSLHDKCREDPLYTDIRSYVMGSGVASTSSIMRMFGLGYGRAASFLDTLEEDGVIMTKPGGRKVVIKKSEE